MFDFIRVRPEARRSASIRLYNPGNPAPSPSGPPLLSGSPSDLITDTLQYLYQIFCTVFTRYSTHSSPRCWILRTQTQMYAVRTVERGPYGDDMRHETRPSCRPPRDSAHTRAHTPVGAANGFGGRMLPGRDPSLGRRDIVRRESAHQSPFYTPHTLPFIGKVGLGLGLG